jgi:acyl carrier protein
MSIRREQVRSRLDVSAQVRQAVAAHSGLGDAVSTLGDDDDLWAAGMGSMAGVRVMLAIEQMFGVEFPDELLTRETFKRINSIADAVAGRLAVSEESA